VIGRCAKRSLRLTANQRISLARIAVGRLTMCAGSAGRIPAWACAVLQREGVYRIVVATASAGGIEAISSILARLSPAFPIPIAIVQHRSTLQPNRLARVLQRSTRLKVKDAEAGEAIVPGTVYLARPGAHLVVDETGRLALVDGERVKHVRPSGDVLFASAAKAFGADVIAVVLTGGDSDGADGIGRVKEAGGTVIVQDAASAKASDMPRSAIGTGAVDWILPLEEIGPALEALGGSRGARVAGR
jgi:two-component system, chemotaxis family, protein-glutamate methylesterase/glutaminase